MRWSLVLLTASAMAACGPVPRQSAGGYDTRSCGLLACVSSGYLAAKLGPDLLGQPVGAALDRAGAPSATFNVAGVDYLSWRRQQQDGGAVYSCEERIQTRGGRVTDYSRSGNC